MAINTDPKFKCPDGHLKTEHAGSLASDEYDFEKWWCTHCEKFFYIHTLNGGRAFSDTFSGEMQISLDRNLDPEDGFEMGKNGVIRKIDRSN